MQQSGGLLPARARPSRTFIFAYGENANQVPPRPPNKKDIRMDVLFLFGGLDLKRAALRSMVNQCPVDTCLALRKVPLFPGAVRRTLNGKNALMLL